MEAVKGLLPIAGAIGIVMLSISGRRKAKENMGNYAEVEPELVKIGTENVVNTLEDAFEERFGRLPTTKELSILLAQSDHETGGWSKFWNNNWAGIKGLPATPQEGVLGTTLLKTKEGYGESEVSIRDRFRAYSEPYTGALDWLRLLQERYPKAIKALTVDQDPVLFAHGLKAGGWFTGDPTVYALSLARLAAKWEAELSPPDEVA